MVQRALAHALAKAVEAGSADAVLPALRGFDPLIRLFARQRLRTLSARARVATSSEDPLHLVRVTFLMLVVGMPAADWDDAEGIAREFAEALPRAKPPLRGPWVIGASMLTLTLAITLPILWYVVSRPFDPREHEVGRTLSAEVPDYVVALSEGAYDRADAVRKRAASNKAVLGDDASKCLDDMLAAADAVARSNGDRKQATDRFTAATVTFDKALAERKLPYFVDADVLASAVTAKPLLFTYYVERDAVFESGTSPVRVVHLWRMDRLNLVQSYLGYTRPSTPAAIVLLDRVEADLVQFVLPALPDGEPMTLVDLETRVAGEDWVEPLEKWGGDKLRSHFAAIPEGRADSAREVGKLLARRRALIDAWRKDLAGLGHMLRVPERLIPEGDYAKELALRISRKQLYEWDDLHDDLTEPELLAAFVALRTVYVRGVERHEVQHRLDYARELVPVPHILASMLGLQNPLDAPHGSMAARARDELSAYLASIITAEGSPVLELLLLGRHLFDKHALGGAYWYAALAAYRGIADELGIDHQKILGRGAVRRDRSAALAEAVLARPPEEIRQAATRLYEKSYGQKLPVVALRSATDNTPWRH